MSTDTTGIAFTVDGPPVPMARARVFVRANGKIGAANPARPTAYKARIRAHFLAVANRTSWPKDAAYSVELRVFWQDARRRDLDNIAKSYLDGLNGGVAWNDDSQVDELHVYGAIDRKNPRVCVLIRAKAKEAA